MAHQIIKQPNGKYLVFSSIVDAVILYNYSEEDLVQHYLEVEEEKIRTNISKIIEKIENDEKPYYQFTRTFEEVIELHNKNSEEKIDKNKL